MKITKKILSIILSMIMIMSAMPITALANDAVSYIERSYKNEKVIEKTKSVTDYIIVDENTSSFENEKWYVVNRDVTNNNRIYTNGVANLILMDGKTLNLPNGINVGGVVLSGKEGNTLNIYGQENNSGKVIAESKYNAAIGGDAQQRGSLINIHGGTVIAKSDWGAGIGGGDRLYGHGAIVTIYGGIVSAEAYEGAAIGGGSGEYSGGNMGGNIYIYGGKVTAISKSISCALLWGANDGYGGSITLGKGVTFGAGANANKITEYGDASDVGDAKGKKYFVSPYTPESKDDVSYSYYTEENSDIVKHEAICDDYRIVAEGSTSLRDGRWYIAPKWNDKGSDDIGNCLNVYGEANLILCDGANLFISGINITDGSTLNIYGQRNGTGTITVNNRGIYGGGTIKIHGGIINSYGHNDSSAISCNNIRIYDGTIKAIGDRNGAGIGCNFIANYGNITIFGGTINATGGYNAAGIGGGSSNEGAGAITIYGGTINATGGENAAGIGSGSRGRYAQIYIYGGTVNAIGGVGSAGIGSGSYCNRGSAITIYDGIVNATGENQSIGIGCGTDCNGTVAIYGGTVTAKGKDSSISSGMSTDDSCSFIVGDDVHFAFGSDAEHTTVSGDKNNASNALGEKYYYSHYGANTLIATEKISDATCISPAIFHAYCSVCGLTNQTVKVGEQSDHDYAPATCTEPSICKVCGKKNGTSFGHDIVNASCTAPKHCSRCDLEIGSPLGHNWVVKDCYQPRECANCGEKEDYTYGHDFRPYEKVDDQESYPDTYKAKCVNCGDLIDYMSYKESYSKEEDVNFEDVYEGDTFKPGIKIAPVNNGEAGKMIVSVDGVETTVNADSTFTVPNCTECTSKNVDSDGIMYLMLTTICTFTYPTCQNIPECIFCGNTAGKLDGHTWVEATCTEPRKCFFCGETEGEALGHSYTELGRLISYETCTSPAIYAAECERCHEENGTIELGEPIGHDYIFVSSSSDGFVKNYHCFRCDKEKTIDKTALASVIALANDEYINNDLANKMYSNISQLKFMVTLGNVTLNSETATQENVDSAIGIVQSAINKLKLKTYSVTVNKIIDGDIADTETVSVAYGEMFNYFVDLAENQAIYKWVMEADERDVKLNTTTQDLSQVINGNVTFNCYIDNSDTKEENTARVIFYDKGDRVIKLDYVAIGSTVDMNVEAPKVAFYDFIGWETVSGDPTNVDKSGVSLRATYAPKNIAANKSTIVAFGNVKVNGKQTTTEFYDAKITLTGADSYAYCDADGNILQGINGNVIYAPNNSQTIYVCAGVSDKASTSITGVIDDANKITINAQYYLPSGSSVVEAGIVISKTKENPTINYTGCQALKSSQQGSSGEYSISLKYTTTGTIYAVSYLTYKEADGTLHTIYSCDTEYITYGA